MIPKATILGLAADDGVQPSTIEKDYALGWLLYGIAQHPTLSRWVFKGGTCLKKCFFETYRFSEDLDFTVPADLELTQESVSRGLIEVCHWVTSESGIEFAHDGVDVEVYVNKQGSESITAKVTYSGPLKLARRSLQRIKLDLTQHELLVDGPVKRAIFHRYEDRTDPTPSIYCYTVDEILAEKTRALYERQGRARDVYDVVNIDRNFRDEIHPARALEILKAKFAYKKLPEPRVSTILARIDRAQLDVAWEQQLRHQLPLLPPVDSFLSALTGALAWWMEPQTASAKLLPAPVRESEVVLPRERFVTPQSRAAPIGPIRSPRRGTSAESALDRIRFAARNHLLVELQYDAARRVVEPYSLRYARSTGRTNLFVYELSRDGQPTNSTKAYNAAKLEAVTVMEVAFTPRWTVEL